MDADPASDADQRFMARAIQLAEQGWGQVHPNPLVGAVVVRDDTVVGEGAHLRYGGPHAEVEALRAAGDRARGATLYVTLEPCAHTGKTPACTTTILEQGVARVVYAVADPHPDAGGGAALLERGGVAVEVGVGGDRARRQNALFLRPLERATPFVALKFGLTLDARIARTEGERTAVTGPDAQAEVHRLRSGFDALLVGAHTVQVDDPLLTVRHAPAPRVPPTRVVVDPMATLSLDSALVGSVAQAPVRVLVGPQAPGHRVDELEAAGVDVSEVEAGPGGLDMGPVLATLWREGLRTVLCEGGGRLGAALTDADQVDRLYLFYAPAVYGEAGVPAFPGSLGFRGDVTEVRTVGGDVLVIVDRSA